MNKDLEIIGIASGIGAGTRGAELGVWDIYYHLKKIDPTLSFNKIFIHDSFATKAEALAPLSNLFQDVYNHIINGKKEKKLFFSGDHANAFAIWSALLDLYNNDMGLIWIDAHLDCHTSKTSPSANIHGMPVAHLLGHGYKEFTKLMKGKFKPENICYIGTRDYETEELTFITENNIKAFYMKDINKNNIDSVFKEAVALVTKNTNNFGVSLDIDSLDPEEAPGTGCYNPNGLWVNEVARNLGNLAQDKKFVGLEITEYNPIKDVNSKTREAILKLVANTFNFNNK